MSVRVVYRSSRRPRNYFVALVLFLLDSIVIINLTR